MTSLAEMRDGLHVSVSQVKTYLRCPRSYELRYVRGLPPAFVPVALAFGSATHGALAFFYGQLKATGTAPPLDALVAVFRDLWAAAQDGPVPLQAESGDSGVDHVERGTAMLAAFYRSAVAAPVDVDGIEVPFAVELHDPSTGEVLEEKLVGSLDLVVREGERCVVVEHKTAARRWSEDQFANDMQVTAYGLAAEKMGLGDVGLRFQVITKTKTPAVQIEDVVRGERDTDDLLRTTIGVLRAVDAGVFYPVRGSQCRTCPYQGPCAGARS